MMTPIPSLAVVLLAFASTAAVAAEWRVEPRESRLNFAPTYEGRATQGRFRDFGAKVQFDPAQPERGRLEVSVDIRSADLNSADINEAIRATEWFDVMRYPKAEFVSSRISRADGHFVADGALKLKGVTKDVRVPFDWEGSGGSARMTGHLSLDRTDFQIGTGEWADGRTIARPVEVRFDLRLKRVD